MTLSTVLFKRRYTGFNKIKALRELFENIAVGPHKKERDKGGLYKLREKFDQKSGRASLQT